MAITNKKLVAVVETSGRIGSVAIGNEDSILYESTFSGFMKHSAELFDALSVLLSKVGAHPEQIGQLYITAGPGSFTGIRIAVTLAKMLSYAMDTRVVAVNTLDAAAENASAYIQQTGDTLQRVAPILDAKQNRFFTAVYRRDGDDWTKEHPESLLYPDQLLSLIKDSAAPVGLLGEGLVYYAEKFTSPMTRLLDETYWPVTAGGVYAAGRKMAQRGQFCDINTLVPTYIRKPDAVEKRERQNTASSDRPQEPS